MTDRLACAQIFLRWYTPEFQILSTVRCAGQDDEQRRMEESASRAIGDEGDGIEVKGKGRVKRERKVNTTHLDRCWCWLGRYRICICIRELELLAYNLLGGLDPLCFPSGLPEILEFVTRMKDCSQSAMSMCIAQHVLMAMRYVFEKSVAL